MVGVGELGDLAFILQVFHEVALDDIELLPHAFLDRLALVMLVIRVEHLVPPTDYGDEFAEVVAYRVRQEIPFRRRAAKHGGVLHPQRNMCFCYCLARDGFVVCHHRLQAGRIDQYQTLGQQRVVHEGFDVIQLSAYIGMARVEFSAPALQSGVISPRHFLCRLPILVVDADKAFRAAGWQHTHESIDRGGCLHCRW